MALDLWNNSHPRDKNRSLTKTEKNFIIHRQNNKCDRCGKPLDSRDTEFDHKKNWADNGKTTVENMRALCGSCHNIVTYENRLKKIVKKKAKKRKTSNPFEINSNDLFKANKDLFR